MSISVNDSKYGLIETLIFCKYGATAPLPPDRFAAVNSAGGTPDNTMQHVFVAQHRYTSYKSRQSTIARHNRLAEHYGAY